MRSGPQGVFSGVGELLNHCAHAFLERKTWTAVVALAKCSNSLGPALWLARVMVTQGEKEASI